MSKKLTDIFLEGLIKKSESIPSHVMEQVRKCLMDYMGVVAGGAQYLLQQHPEYFSTLVQEQGDCSVFGTPCKTSMLNAALLNGFSAHVLELDDGHRFGMIHLGASIISAVLVVAEKENLLQNDVMRGIVMGYETAIRCACSLQPGHKVRGYHVSGTCGTIGSALGVAFARGYGKTRLKSTLDCAVTSAAALLEIQEETSELKPYNLGRAATDGVAAAMMGSLALSGPDDILGGKRGLLSVLTDTPTPKFLTNFSSESYGIEGIYQKLYAACRHCHPAIEAALSLRNDFQAVPRQIQKVEVHTYKLAVCGHDHKDIKGMSSAKLSIPFSVALSLVKGNAGYADFNEENLHDEEILSLARRVGIFEDELLTSLSPQKRAAKVVIFTEKGVFEKRVDYPKGEPENPLSQQELEDKFRGLAMYGGLSATECDEIISEVWKERIDLNKITNIICK